MKILEKIEGPMIFMLGVSILIFLIHPIFLPTGIPQYGPEHNNPRGIHEDYVSPETKERIAWEKANPPGRGTYTYHHYETDRFGETFRVENPDLYEVISTDWGNAEKKTKIRLSDGQKAGLVK